MIYPTDFIIIDILVKDKKLIDELLNFIKLQKYD